MEAILLSKEQCISKNAREYTKASLGTSEGIINVYCWDGTLRDLDVYSCISFSLSTSNGFNTASTVVKIFEVPSLIQKYKPRIISDDYFYSLQKGILSKFHFLENEQNLLTSLFNKVYAAYYDRYAATNYHHNYKGGLLTHTVELVELYLSLCTHPIFVESDPFVVLVACLLHDYGKVQEYTNEGTVTDYFFLFGHIYLSARYAEDICDMFSINPNKKLNIIHCILSHHGRVEYGSPIVPSTKEAFLVSKLDELSGFGYQFNIEGNEMNYNSSRNKVIVLDDNK